MTYTLREVEYKGYTIKIEQDVHAGNPREDFDHLGLFLGFPHRDYRVGDEQVDPRDWSFDCNCDGGTVRFPFLGEDVERECGGCQGAGRIYVRSFADAVRYVREHYNAVGPVLPVSMIDHSSVHYFVGRNSDPWDGSDIGLIFTTQALLDKAGHEEQPSDDDLTTWLTGEIKEYNAWANGEVWGYVVGNDDDEHIESCWGYIGEDDYAEEEAKRAVDYLVEQDAYEENAAREQRAWDLDVPEWTVAVAAAR